MSVLTVKFDHNLTLSDIEIPLKAPQDSEVGENNGTMTAEAQTMIQGVCTPILAINNIVFEIEQILELTLYNNDRLPSIRAVVNDSEHMLGDLELPGRDNEIRLQILPPFDNAYKKINLVFFIDSIRVNGSNILVTGKYKVNDLYSSRFSSFGEINTYDLFQTIAHECKLGFATNCESNDIDKRFVYANNSSYVTLMNKQIKQSGDETLVYDYWVDLWNNINLANIYERYNTKDPDEEMLVWLQKGYPVHTQKDDPIEPEQQIALINNNPIETGPLKASAYNVITNSGKATVRGTDQVYTYYKDGQVIDTLVQDGSVKEDIFTRYEYLGENIGDFDYLAARSIRKSFIDIVTCNCVEVTVNFPCLSLMRGHQCLFTWYENNYTTKTNLQYMNDIDSELPVNDQDLVSDPDSYIVNKQISGQYLIYGVVIDYNRGKWQQKLTLVRPQDQVHKYINAE